MENEIPKHLNASEAAAMLGRMAKGVPKTFTNDYRQELSKRFTAARKSRWPGPAGDPRNKEARGIRTQDKA